MNLNIPTNQTVEHYLHHCSERERLRVFMQAHYERNMFGGSKDKKLIGEIDRVMGKMGYKT